MPTNSIPSLSCDCHVHVVGEAAAFPMIPERQYTAGPVNVQDLRQHMSGLGFGRAVVVQPSFYGVDNRYMLHCLGQMAGAGRGVAVVKESTGDDELLALHQCGVRGVRINVESSHGQGKDQAQFSLEQSLISWSERLAAIAHLGWHVQVFAALDLIAACAKRIESLSFDMVLDHFAMVPTPTANSDPNFSALLRLLSTGKIWIKLSAAYRPPTKKDRDEEAFIRLAQLLINTNPERIVWGSDWPHTQREAGKAPHETSSYRKIGSDILLEQIHNWLPSESLLEQVLVNNPAKLYQF
jgi:predicted TIM-barrel fold metal-dependent hydrolase